MPSTQQPSVRDLHIDQPLTNISIAYKNKQYIADQIFPIVPVNKQSDYIPEVLQSEGFRNGATLRAPGTRAVEGGMAIKATSLYTCQEYAYAFPIADEQRANADAPWDLDRMATEMVTSKLQLQREIAFSTDFFTTSVWKTDKTGNSDFTYWDTFATSSPLSNIEEYRDTILGLSGTLPNMLVMGSQVWSEGLKFHPDVVDSIKYTGLGVGSEKLLAELTGFEKILIGTAIYTTSPEVSYTSYGTTGAGTDNETLITYSRVWGKSALMLYVPSAPSLLTPAAGYTFVWTKNGPGQLQYIKRFRRDEEGADVIACYSCYDQKALATRCGLFMSAAVA